MPKRETLMEKPSALRYMDRPANRLTAGRPIADELRHLLGDILLFGIGAQHDGAEELHGEDEQREADHRERRPE